GPIETEVAVLDRDVVGSLDFCARAVSRDVDEVAPDVVDGDVVEQHAVVVARELDAVLERVRGVVAGLVLAAFDSEILDDDVLVAGDSKVIPVLWPVVRLARIRRVEL